MTEDEKKAVYLLAQKMTGAHPEGTFQHNIFITNIERRMREKNKTRLADYLALANSDPTEHAELISALSIHTTSWFRENPHYVILQKIILEKMHSKDLFRVWCAATSTGEEVYSFALLLEEFRRFHKDFNYSILGTDIDPKSLDHAKRAVYPKKSLSGPVSHYTNHILYGSGKTEGYFTFTPELRSRCEFRPHDIRQPLSVDTKFDIIVCRNVLIYFSQPVVHKVIRELTNCLRPGGHLILGHSEIIQYKDFGLDLIEHAVYCKTAPIEKRSELAGSKEAQHSKQTTNILAVDDSALARERIRQQLEKFDYKVYTAESAAQAEEIMARVKVDAITLDLNMPGVSGEQWLKSLRTRRIKTPVIIVSEISANDAKEVLLLLEAGALSYIEKREVHEQPEALPQVIMHILESRNISSGKLNSKLPKKLPAATFRPSAILIGVSTGGPNVLSQLLPELPIETPPIVLVQHINPKFSKSFADRMVQISNLKPGRIIDGEILKNGHIYIATGDYHLAVDETPEGLKLRLKSSPAVNSHRPSVDVLFQSAANTKSEYAAILLTGMGKDGAAGMEALHQQKSYTMAQSEEDCIVYGMPKEAILRDCVDFVGTIEEIRSMILTMTSRIG